MKTKIVVGVSGGVDSALALFLLKEQGFDPIGVSLKIPVWGPSQDLTSLKESKDLCDSLGVPHFVYDVSKEFEKSVVSYYLKDFKNNKTPNPCVFCNKHFKFKYLFKWAKKNKINFIATGHYAGTRYNEKTKKYELILAKDKKKDQTYGLSLLTSQELSKIKFPLSDLTKEEVYDLAKKHNLKSFVSKKQSQDFCYLSNKDLPKFLEKHLGLKQGKIVDKDLNHLGDHKGNWFYTIGQRKGLGLNSKHYVYDKKNNDLFVSNNLDVIKKKEINLSKVHFISGETPSKKIKVKIRYSSDFLDATIVKNKNLKIILDKEIPFITPGQFCVFYEEDVCLGAGIIK